MRTFALFVAGFVVGTLVVNACGKKAEVPAAPVAVDAGVVEVVKPAAVAAPVSATAPVVSAPVESVAPSTAPAAPDASVTSASPVTPVVPSPEEPVVRTKLK